LKVLAIDIGSSSVKCAILHSRRIVGGVVRTTFPTLVDGPKVEVEAASVRQAVVDAIARVGRRAKDADVIAIDVMAPSFLLMDRKGEALTNAITHQDRRSIDAARAIEKRVGRTRHLRLAGNRPVPGGISSTSFAWLKSHESARLKKADLAGHLLTYLHRHLTGARVIDPSVASFSGVYSTITQKGWNDELCDAVGMSKHLLPEIREGNEVAGRITRDAASRFGLGEGTPVLTGVIDGSCGMLVAGAVAGRVMNVCGSTDVLAVCTDNPKPNENLLTRALGVGKLWVYVANIPAAGSAVLWAKHTLFADLPEASFYRLIAKLSRSSIAGDLTFDPRLAGSRTQIESLRGGIAGLTLSTTREMILSALLDSLARTSADRVHLIQTHCKQIDHNCLVTGGLAKNLSHLLHRDWPGKWKFRYVEEATLLGLGVLAGS